MDFYAALQAVINGLLTGALYALVGMGLALIFGVMRIVNFAHGAFMMLGMYATYVLFTRTQMSPYCCSSSAASCCCFWLRHLLWLAAAHPREVGFHADPAHAGHWADRDGCVLLVFGADYHQINIPLLGKNFHLGSHISVNAPWVVSFGIAVVLAFALYLFVTRTMFGRAARAIAQNRIRRAADGNQCIPGAGNCLRESASPPPGSPAALLLPVFYIYPEVGDPFTLKAFVMVVLGGMESIVGAALAGLVLGVVESLTSLYWGNEWALAVDFVIFLLVLSLKPSGIFGSQKA